MNVYLDTSAVVKLYHLEQGTENLIEFLKQRVENLTIRLFCKC